MRIIYFSLLCCAAVLPAACVPGTALRTGGPEKTFLGYRIEVPDNKESSRVAAEQQARAFCEREKKQYVFSRFVTWPVLRLGRYIPTYSFYFVCYEPKVVKLKSAKPKKLTPQKSEAAAGAEEQSREEEAVSADRKASEKPVMIVTPEPEVSAPSTNIRIRTIEARPSKIQVTALSRERGRRKLNPRQARASEIWLYDRDKNYVPGEPESLGPPGAKVHPSLLGGHFTEETLQN